MKRSILVTAFVAATFWIANTPAYAQHGGSASHGAGAPSMHGSTSSEGGHDSSRPTPSPSSPGSVLANSHLSDALTDALAKRGITLNGRTLGEVCTNPDVTNPKVTFKTLGQCIAALHINHKFSTCSLDKLAAAKSLGAGIQACRPDADTKADARSATKQAKQDIKDANS